MILETTIMMLMMYSYMANYEYQLRLAISVIRYLPTQFKIERLTRY